MDDESLVGTKEDKKTLSEHFEEHEFKIYKRFHRIVMKDLGLPTLKKRAFQMPG